MRPSPAAADTRSIQHDAAFYRDGRRFVVVPDQLRHVVPELDELPHRFGLDCPCGPVLELEGGITYVVHTEWDARSEHPLWWIEPGEIE